MSNPNSRHQITLTEWELRYVCNALSLLESRHKVAIKRLVKRDEVRLEEIRKHGWMGEPKGETVHGRAMILADVEELRARLLVELKGLGK
jgi:hypothetical protein